MDEPLSSLAQVTLIPSFDDFSHSNRAVRKDESLRRTERFEPASRNGRSCVRGGFCDAQQAYANDVCESMV